MRGATEDATGGSGEMTRGDLAGFLKDEGFGKMLAVLKPEGIYPPGCPWNEDARHACELAYLAAGDDSQKVAAVDGRIDKMRRGLREEAQAGLIEGKRYSDDARWAVELRAMSEMYEHGEFDVSDEGRELRELLAEACDHYAATGSTKAPEGLVRRYVRLTYDSWLRL